nr:hypothetical protein pM02_c90_01 [uncultured bacterium]
MGVGHRFSLHQTENSRFSGREAGTPARLHIARRLDQDKPPPAGAAPTVVRCRCEWHARREWHQRAPAPFPAPDRPPADREPRAPQRTTKPHATMNPASSPTQAQQATPEQAGTTGQTRLHVDSQEPPCRMLRSSPSCP